MTPPIAPDWLAAVGADAVLAGQGADARRLRERSPRLLAIAERAARDGAALVCPRIAARVLPVRRRDRGDVSLEGGARLTGTLIAERLAAAEGAAIVVATVGDALERRVSRMFGRDLPYALALDGFGSAALEALVRSVTRHLRECARATGATVMRPISPGMEGFDLSRGQQEISEILGRDAAGVTLLPTGGMTPRKSLTLVFGVGRGDAQRFGVCDSCPARPACRFRALHDPKP
jgi:hypothetical protein